MTEVDSGDNVFLAGYTAGTVDGQPNAGSDDILLMKFDSSGAWQWTTVRGTADSDQVHAMEARAERVLKSMEACAVRV